MSRSRFDGVVIISPFAWPGPSDMWQATHHIARGFARRYPTLVVEPPVQWNPASEVFDPRRLRTAVIGLPIRPVADGLLLFRRRGLPLGRFGAVRDFDLGRNATLLRQELARLGFRRTLLWHSFPYRTTELVDAVSPAVFAYHCLDHSARDEEQRLVERADAVFAVSDALVARLRGWNPRTFLLPNGVDLPSFSPEGPDVTSRPPDLPTKGRLLGFVGSINCHLDIESLLRLAQAFPRDSLVLLGRIMKNESRPGLAQAKALATLMRQPNVHFLGFKPASRLGAYLAAFDVCLNPLLPDPFNAGRDPMKFYQYLAMGKPIVTSPTSTTASHADLCYVCDSPEAVVARTVEALSEDHVAMSARRRGAASRHDWDARVEDACRILGGLADAALPAGVHGMSEPHR